MVKNVGKYKVPFDFEGNQLHYPGTLWDRNKDGGRGGNAECIWKENQAFTDTLKVEGMHAGQSAKYLTVVSTTTGHHYTVFVRDVIDVLLNATVNKGEMTATWTFTKRGANYGVAVLEA